MNKLVAAVAQTATVLFDTPATIERALGLMADAAGRGVQLLVFPEAFIGGYPKGADFHIYLGGRTPAGRAEFKRYFDAAVTVDGPEIAQLAKAAARHRCTWWWESSSATAGRSIARRSTWAPTARCSASTAN